MTRQLFLICLSCLLGSLYMQPANNVKKIAKDLARINVYDADRNARSAQEKLFNSLLVEAELSELSDLCKHRNAVVRLYGFRALARLERQLPESLVQRMLSDHELVNVQRNGTTVKIPAGRIAGGFLY